MLVDVIESLLEFVKTDDDSSQKVYWTVEDTYDSQDQVRKIIYTIRYVQYVEED